MQNETNQETVGDVLYALRSLGSQIAHDWASRIERAHARDSAMREAIRRMAQALESGEWAEHVLDSDDDVSRLEAQITRLVGAQAAGAGRVPPAPDGFEYVQDGGRSEVFDVAAWPDHAGIWRDDETGLPVLHRHGELADWPSGHYNVVLLQVRPSCAAPAPDPKPAPDVEIKSDTVIDKLLETAPMPDLSDAIKQSAERILAAVSNPSAYGGKDGVLSTVRSDVTMLHIAACRVREAVKHESNEETREDRIARVRASLLDRASRLRDPIELAQEIHGTAPQPAPSAAQPWAAESMRYLAKLLRERGDDLSTDAASWLERLAPSDAPARCTCPSGDGSLRWPCPSHPPDRRQPWRHLK